MSDLHGARPILSLDRVSVAFGAGADQIEVVRDATFSVHEREVLGLVGESGSGKTVTSMAILGLLGRRGGRVTSGQMRFNELDLTTLRESEWAHVRGSRIGIIFQQPTRSLNPAFTVGDQIAESIRIHMRLPRRVAWARAVEMLDRVQIANAAKRARDYPHMLSGGMCQRVMIAMALACEPELLIADEPTTALDVTVQAKILDLLRDIVASTAITVIYISHDLAVIAEIADRVAVMYGGETIEVGAVGAVFSKPLHPYTEALLESAGRAGPSNRLSTIPGQVPSPRSMPQGCRFHPRCRYVDEAACVSQPLEIRSVEWLRESRCVRASDLDLTGLC